MTESAPSSRRMSESRQASVSPDVSMVIDLSAMEGRAGCGGERGLRCRSIETHGVVSKLGGGRRVAS